MVESSKNNSIPPLQIKRILVPTDFSDCSQKAVEYASALARNLQAKIFLLHVIETSVYSLDTSLMPPGDPFGLRQKLAEMVEQAVQLLKEKGIDAAGECITGIPATEVMRTARERNADLVVMGTHGRTGLAHVLLGSTTERVIQRVQCPVLAVKAEKKKADEAGKKGDLEEKRRLVQEMVPRGEKVTYCHLCGQQATDIICDACKVRVQTEAFEMKQRVEKEGRVDTGRR